MQDYTPPVGTQFNPTITEPQDVVDDVIVSTVNPAFERNADNCSALYFAYTMGAVAGWQNLDTALSFRRADVVGFGANVGWITIYDDDKIVGMSDQGLTLSILATLTVPETLGAAFAQDENAMTIIGSGMATTQKAWRSVNGGISWTEVALPALVNPSDAIYVHYAKGTGYWYIFRESAGVVQVVRSTDNGATWSAVGGGQSFLTNSITAASAEDGTLFLNASTFTLNSTFKSSDNGATWSNAYAPASRYINAVTEFDGEVYALGYNSTGGGSLYVAKWTGSAWTEITTSAAPGPKSFTRMAVPVGPLIVALAVDTFAANDTGSMLASRDGGVTWRSFRVASLAEIYSGRTQAPSPGGVHVFAYNSDETILLARTELW